MKGLSVNDSFSTREEAEKVVLSHAEQNGLVVEFESTNKSIVACCRGKDEFGCEAKIVAQPRKKDDSYVVKKIKLVHKCPSVTQKYNTPDEMVRSEIHKAIGGRGARIGEMVCILAEMDIRMGYFSVWKAMRQGREFDKENEAQAEAVDGNKANAFKGALGEFSLEFSEKNPSAAVKCMDNAFFFSYPEYLDVLVPVVEIRVYKRTDGFAVFGVLRDPTWAPVVHSCIVSEGISMEDTIRCFVDFLPGVFFLVDFDTSVVGVLEAKKREYFIKTRDICRFYHGKGWPTEAIESVWNRCNNDTTCSMPELDGYEKKRYIKRYCKVDLFGMQNTGECDVDFIGLGMFNLQYFDCLNGILKQIGDNMRYRKKAISPTDKRPFGKNVVHRIEKNVEMCKSVTDDVKKVDLTNQTCMCGRFQEFLIPCVHACRKIIELGEDPYAYVSNVYLKTRLLKLNEVIPVVDLQIKCQPDRNLLKRGPGRPKKIQVHEPQTFS
ncbi:hypothetical protein HK407_01g02390 [Ordospora pajunii]|uniref:uncharacterized protein n=1 Tax=Ordospora pajunii TaxID=3039483 RepID=UPI00295267D5|nr:uncharacterized protein HK407_01g02390 [Ordospora pajunii]KAH9412344.1 hypothetical protein HK407_01g02390 [Ordospora pajunii]